MTFGSSFLQKRSLYSHTMMYFHGTWTQWSLGRVNYLFNPSNFLYLWNQLPNLCGVFTRLKPKQYPDRKMPKKQKSYFFDFRLLHHKWYFSVQRYWNVIRGAELKPPFLRDTENGRNSRNRGVENGKWQVSFSEMTRAHICPKP